MVSGGLLSCVHSLNTHLLIPGSGLGAGHGAGVAVLRKGVSLALELQCLRRQVISRCRCCSPQVKDAEGGTGPARGA